MTRIAEVAGYSIGTVYQYFPDRRALLCELMHEVCEGELEAVISLIPELGSASVPDAVDAVLRVLIASASKNRVLLGLLVGEVGPSLEPEAIEDLVPSVAPLLAMQLEVRAGEVAVRCFDMAARLILVGVEAIVHDAAVEHPEWFDDDVLLAELRALVLGYLGLKAGEASGFPDANEPLVAT